MQIVTLSLVRSHQRGYTSYMRYSIVIAILLLLSGSELAYAQSLLKDINAVPLGSRARGHTPAGSRVVFMATDDAHGRELWVTDGTRNGTHLLSDLNPGKASSTFSEIHALSGRALFFERGSSSLYVTDGTVAGTSKLSGGTGINQPSHVVPTSGATFIVTNNGGSSLMALDDGSTSLRAVSIGSPSGTSTAVLQTPHVSGDSLYVLVSQRTDPTAPRRTSLWRTSLDGRSAQEVSVDASSWSELLGVASGRFISLRRTPENAWALYAWSRDDGDILLDELSAPDDGIESYVVGHVQGRVIYFSMAYSGAPTYTSTDGTVAGTHALFPTESLIAWSQGVLLDDRLLFVRHGAETGRELWSTDGTPSGTRIVADIFPGTGSADPESIRVIGDQVYFCANDGVLGFELWASDGTEQGTRLVADIFEGSGSGNPSGATPTAYGVVLSATDAEYGSETRLVDVTTGAHRMIQPVGPVQTYSAFPKSFVSMSNVALFQVDDGIHGRELWRTDGLAEGTTLVEDATPGPSGSRIQNLGCPDDGCIWFRNDGLVLYDAERDNWTQLTTGSETVRNARSAFHTTGSSLFALETSLSGTSFWLRTGAESDLTLLSDVGNPLDPSRVLGFVDGKWIIQVGTGIRTLTPSGSSEELHVAAHAGTPFWSVTLDERVIVGYPGGMLPTDGTPDGTATFFNVFDPVNMFVKLGNRVLYPGNYTGFGNELMISDGTAQGTSPLADLIPGLGSSSPRDLFEFGGNVYFTALSTDGVRVLWKTDGTAAGTAVLWDDFGPVHGGVLDFLPLVSLDDRFLFTIDHSSFGRELWMTDGTTAGTLVLADVIPGPDGSDPQHAGRTGRNVVFSAQTPDFGRELWSIDLDALTTGTEDPIVLPGDLDLSPVHPNPFSDAGRFTVTTAVQRNVEVALYDILGRKVEMLFRGTLEAGRSHTFNVNGSSLSTGLYVISVTGDGISLSRRAVHVH